MDLKLVVNCLSLWHVCLIPYVLLESLYHVHINSSD